MWKLSKYFLVFCRKFTCFGVFICKMCPFFPLVFLGYVPWQWDYSFFFAGKIIANLFLFIGHFIQKTSLIFIFYFYFHRYLFRIEVISSKKSINTFFLYKIFFIPYFAYLWILFACNKLIYYIFRENFLFFLFTGNFTQQ